MLCLPRLQREQHSAASATTIPILGSAEQAGLTGTALNGRKESRMKTFLPSHSPCSVCRYLCWHLRAPAQHTGVQRCPKLCLLTLHTPVLHLSASPALLPCSLLTESQRSPQGGRKQAGGEHLHLRQYFLATYGKLL